MAHLTENERRGIAAKLIRDAIADYEYTDVVEHLEEPHPDADEDDFEAIHELITEAELSVSFD